MAKKPNLPAHAPGTSLADQRTAHLLQHAGAGTERVTLQDILLPRLKILQALSPECNRRKPEYVPGAEPGLILNVATLQLFESVTVVPASYIRHHIEWLPNRGGFVRDHGDNETVMSHVVKRDDKNFDILGNGNLIIPTPTWYVILVSGVRVIAEGEKVTKRKADLGGDPGIIAMPRTQAKPSRSWMAQATSEKLTHPEHGQFAAPLFYRSWELSTTERDDGENSWFVWSVAPKAAITDTVDGKADSDLVLPADIMPRAIRFREQVNSGAVRATAEHFADDETSGGRGGGEGQNSDRPM